MSDRTFRGCRLATAMMLLTLGLWLASTAPAAADEFEESRSQWSVAPPTDENEQPGVQRDGTLRIIRFANDRQILNDKGTVVGFASIVARTGELPPTHEKPTDEKSILEIMRRGELNELNKD